MFRDVPASETPDANLNPDQREESRNTNPYALVRNVSTHTLI